MLDDTQHVCRFDRNRRVCCTRSGWRRIYEYTILGGRQASRDILAGVPKRTENSDNSGEWRRALMAGQSSSLLSLGTGDEYAAQHGTWLSWKRPKISGIGSVNTQQITDFDTEAGRLYWGRGANSYSVGPSLIEADSHPRMEGILGPGCDSGVPRIRCFLREHQHASPRCLNALAQGLLMPWERPFAWHRSQAIPRAGHRTKTQLPVAIQINIREESAK